MRHLRVVVSHYGGADALQLVEEELPEPKAGEVRIKMLAAGVAMPDIMAREGIHPETPRVPFTPGWDLVGVVDRLGDGVSGIDAGQVVAAMPIIAKGAAGLTASNSRPPMLAETSTPSAPQALNMPITAPRVASGASWLISVVAPKKALICPMPRNMNQPMAEGLTGSSTNSIAL